MSSRWTQVRRLPARRESSKIQSADSTRNPALRAACIGAAATLLALSTWSHATGAEPLPRNDADSAAAPVASVFNALSHCQARLSESERWRLAGSIHQESRRHGYDPLFIMAMIQVESGCSPTAQGNQGAVGLVQIKPSTARAVAKDAGVPWHGSEALKRPAENVQLALLYLAQLEEQFGDPYLAIVAFNRGPARVGRMSPQRARGARYVKKIMARYEDLTDEAATESADDSL